MRKLFHSARISGETATLTPNRGIRKIPKPRLPWGRLLRTLEVHYGRGKWRVPVLRARGADPFMVLVSTILSQRTRDEVTERATVRLLTEYPTPTAIARAPLGRIRSLIDEVGLADGKARGIRSASQVVVKRFGGMVPLREADLRSLPMVGPKTSHAIRVFAYRLPGLPIDTHILRVSRRLGVVHGKTIGQAQDELSRSVPREYWSLLNPVLVQHGQNICRPSLPRCDVCPISHWCLRKGLPARRTRRTLN